MDKDTPKTRSNIIDRTIGFFSPASALRREQARVALDFIKARRFDAASNTSRFEQWRRPGTGANAALLPALPRLRNSSRDLTRNNPFAENALRVIVNNVVGAGITGQVVGRTETQRKKLQAKWWDWFGTRAVDAEGRLDGAGIQALAMHTIAESGEVLIRKIMRRASDGLPLPIQVQVLEPDYLDDTKDGALAGGGEIIAGIEYNARGTITHYHIRESHPGDVSSQYRAYRSFRVPASEIIHAFDPKRAGQGRGYPWCASAIRRLKDFDDYEDAQLVRQKLAACFVGFVEDMAPPAGATGLEKTGPTEGQKDYMQPGLWEYLPPGKKITFGNPPGVQNYKEYSTQILRGAASTYGITYEAMTNDYSGVNFSSGRMGWLEMNRNVSRWQNTVMRVQILERLAEWFILGCDFTGLDTRESYIKWIYPRREMIDPTKEVPANIKAIRAGITSLSRVHASQGLDSEEVLEEIKAMNKALDAAGIILDSDPRKVNTAGTWNEPDPAPADDPGNNNA